MRRTVIGVFKSLNQAKQAVEEIRGESLANNYISLVVRSRAIDTGNYHQEAARELTPNPAEPTVDLFDGYLVQSDPIDLSDVGEVFAGGPLAYTLSKEAGKGLAGNLANYGVTPEHALHYEQDVRNGSALLVVEADGDYIDRIANHLYTYGGRSIEKWSQTTDRPTFRNK